MKTPLAVPLADLIDMNGMPRMIAAGWVLAAGLMAAAGAAAQGDLAPQPTIQPGDTWQYDFVDRRYGKPGCRYDLTVERVTDGAVHARMQFPPGCEVSLVTAYAVAPGSRHRFDLGMNPYHYSTQPYAWLQFPLVEGKTWRQRWMREQNGWSYEYDIDALVLGRERITVPAGEFDTFKVRLRVAYTGTKAGGITQAGRYEDTLWYAPPVRHFVRRTFIDPGWAHIERQLVSYRPERP